MLNDYIPPEAIKLQVKARDWEEAVRVGGDLMVACGFCEIRYVDAMVQTVHDLGPYMVLAPGIALAHARPEDGMLKVGMSMINLEHPVEFGSEENDPVSLVISFGGIDNESHIGMLTELAAFLVVEDNQEMLKTVSTKEEVLEAFRRE